MTTSERPPPSWASSWVKTAGTEPRLTPFQAVEAEVLVRDAEGDLALADRLRALGQDRPEALGRALEDAERAVEGVGEARGGRGQGDGGELAGEGDVELGELGLEGAVEVRRVRAAVGQQRLAFHSQAVRAVQTGESARPACPSPGPTRSPGRRATTPTASTATIRVIEPSAGRSRGRRLRGPRKGPPLRAACLLLLMTVRLPEV